MRFNQPRTTLGSASLDQRRAHVAAGWVSLSFIVILLFDGFWKTALMQKGIAYFWVFDAFKWILLPTILLWILHGVTSVRAKDYGLTVEFGIADVILISAIPLIGLFFSYLLAELIAAKIFGYSAPHFSHADVLKSLGPLWILGTFYLSITAGLWESVFLIGLPWLWFSRGRQFTDPQKYAAMLVLSAVFGLGHWENGIPNVVGAFVFQFGAIYWYLELRTLWPIVIAHTLIDVYAFWPS